MTLQETRATLAHTLTQDSTYSTFDFPPPVPQPMSVVLEPDDPYIVSTNNRVTLSAKMRLRLRLYVPLLDNAGNLDQLEELAARVRRLALENTHTFGDLSAPSAFESDTGTMLTAYFPVELLTEWPNP